MIFERFEVPGLAHYSYLLGSESQAVVVDPKRDIDSYLRFAEHKGLTITHVLETHIHADYASGAVALAAATGAELWLSAHDQGHEFTYQFKHHPFADGEELICGDLRIVAVHTPGHTPEHLSFLVYERSRCGQPLLLLSGDFLFVGSLGRPDLLGEAAKDDLANALYESVHTKTSNLPDGTAIHPAHGAGSLCGSGMSERPQSTLGYERHCNVFMSDQPRELFVETILRTVPPFPHYYRRMKKVNAEGPRILDELPGGQAFSPAEFESRIAEPGAIVLDLRTPDAFGGSHIPGSLNIGAGQNLSLWAGWVVPYDRPLFLVGDAHTDLESARRSLIRVGHDSIRGSLRGGFAAWAVAGKAQEHIPQLSVLELADKQEQSAFILDVRNAKEWAEGHIASATSIPLGELPRRTHEIPRERPVHIICGSGYRSSVAASLLRRSGVSAVKNVLGGMTAWKAHHLLSVDRAFAVVAGEAPPAGNSGAGRS
ncbi:MAG TPA: MBL fold metallo-hydrolase [Acidobacteriaceae bacterium]|nr:MBL fold metallo-hydrolase [Acidobacteriaceae bacterium]